MMKKTYYRKSAVLLWLLVLLLCLRTVTTFVTTATPTPVAKGKENFATRERRGGVVTTTQWQLSSTSSPFTNHPTTQKDNNKQEKDPKNNLWTKLTDKVHSILPWTKKKTVQEETKEEDDLLITDLMKPTTVWPLQTYTENVSRSIRRALKQEEHKAKPLFQQALTFMRHDNDVQKILGNPLHYGPVISQHTETSIVNGKKTVHIIDKFQVVGSKGITGIATLSADKYAKNHITALRVDINGVHYDIDV
jgi:hypothetical protein